MRRFPKCRRSGNTWKKTKLPDANRRLAVVALGAGGFGSWPIVSTPGLPPDRLKILRDAYAKTLQEPDLLDEAKKRGWELRPVERRRSGRTRQGSERQPADVVERMKKLMGS